jgi:hypothetical protein
MGVAARRPSVHAGRRGKPAWPHGHGGCELGSWALRAQIRMRRGRLGQRLAATGHGGAARLVGATSSSGMLGRRPRAEVLLLRQHPGAVGGAWRALPKAAVCGGRWRRAWLAGILRTVVGARRPSAVVAPVCWSGGSRPGCGHWLLWLCG